MKHFFGIFLRVFLSLTCAAVCGFILLLLYMNAQLPSVEVLEEIQLQVPLKIYTADGLLIGEYGKRRSHLSISQVPELLKLAILATEDKRFYEHSGVDLRGLARASLNLVTSGSKSQGASTITMQVARNFFLSRNKTFARKLNEVLLALKIEKELPKDKILELYLNKIYFGKSAYGVQAAANVYYGISVDKLSLAQMAMLAGLPQAPSAINPISNPKAALKRRQHVLNRMRHYKFITQKQYETASKAPISSHYHGRTLDLEALYVAEMARQELVERFGPEVYTDGFIAYTTINSRLQKSANQSLQQGLLEYDKRHGYRGPVGRIDNNITELASWAQALNTYPRTPYTIPAAVTKVNAQSIQVIFPNQEQATISSASMQWTHKAQLSTVVKRGDIIYVEPKANGWAFSQLPGIEGALIALYPKTGAVLAMVGGFDFNLSAFNRATQGTRQPGSNFKPFIYAAALEEGYTAASIINDAPVIYKDANLDWRPQNDTGRFYGPTRLRVGLTKSRNLVTIRLLQAVGLSKAIATLERFGFDRRRLPRTLSLALGTPSVSPLEIAVGYAVFANGGYKVTPYLLQRVLNNQQQVIYEANHPIACAQCEQLASEGLDPFPPALNAIDEMALKTRTLVSQNPPTSAPQAISAQTAYIMTSLLQDAIQTGTGEKARSLQRTDLAGKTGTTNNKMDAWYTGYNPSLVTSVWVGYDNDAKVKAVGEYGAQAALPIWINFMGRALAGIPNQTQDIPRGIVSVSIDPVTGLLASPNQSNAITEIFREETVPNKMAPLDEPINEFGSPIQAPEVEDDLF